MISLYFVSYRIVSKKMSLAREAAAIFPNCDKKIIRRFYSQWSYRVSFNGRIKMQ